MPYADAFFQYMLALALATNEDIDRIVVVNPAPEILQKFVGLLQPHFSQRRLVRDQRGTVGFIAEHMIEALGRSGEGLSREMIVSTGFQVT
jgi:hypothetical protein